METPHLREDAEERVRAHVREAESYKSPYERWEESQGLPTIRGYQIPAEFEEALAKTGVKCLMLHHPYCTRT